MNDTQGDKYEAAIERAGVAPLRGWSTLRVTGADRATFLHNMCTNDVKALAPGGGCEAFFTDVKGKIVAHGFLLADETSVRIVAVPGTAERLMTHLDRYIIREDVALSDESRELMWMLLFGKESGSVLEWIVGPNFESLSTAWEHRAFDVKGVGGEAVNCPLPWMGGFLIGCPVGAISTLLEQFKLATAGGDAAWLDRLRVESNWPLWGVDFDESNLPQEVSRDAAAISFRKGCYLGQETVARIDALGHVNKHLVAIQFEGDAVPDPGAELFQGEQVVGRVTSSCWSPRGAKPQAIAMVKRGANAAGTSLAWSGGVGTVE